MKPIAGRYRGYEIQVTHASPIYQAAIYPSDPRLRPVDWTVRPIQGMNPRAALLQAKRRIMQTLKEHLL